MRNLLRRLNWPLIVVTFFLVLMGLTELFLLSGASKSLFYKQLIFSIVGLVLMVFVSFFDFRILREKNWLVMVLYILCLLAVGGLFVAGEKIRGAKRWYEVGELTVDPVQFLKLIVIIVLAKCFANAASYLQIRTALKTSLYLLLPVLLIILQPDLGSVIILFLLWLGMLFVFGLSYKHFFAMALIFLVIFSFAWGSLLLPYQKNRIVSFMNPRVDPQGAGYNLRQTLITIGNGGLWGQGVSEASQARLGFLPEPETDFIVSAFAEQLGFWGVFVLVSCWLGLVVMITRIGFTASSRFGFFLVLGVALWIFGQGLVNILVACGLFPVVGITFPFLSYGGSSLIALFTALGLVQGVYLRSSI